MMKKLYFIKIGNLLKFLFFMFTMTVFFKYLYVTLLKLVGDFQRGNQILHGVELIIRIANIPLPILKIIRSLKKYIFNLSDKELKKLSRFLKSSNTKNKNS